MQYGLNISGSGVLTSLYRQDVLSNNLANLNTAGYKPDVPEIRHRDPVREEDGLWHLPSNELIEVLGAGVTPGPNRISFAQGAIETTNNALDLAIRGDGFFVVRTAESGNNDQFALTRDGRFAIDDRRRLVMATSGLPVLDTSNRPIRLPSDSEVSIASDGTLSQEGAEIARINVVDAPDKRGLRKGGGGLFLIDAYFADSLTTATGRVVQGAIEGSATNEIKAMMDIQGASRAVSANIGIMTYHDRMMERAINTFGRVTA